MAKSGTNLGQVDLSSYLADQLLADIPPCGGIWWPKSGTNLGAVDLSSYLAEQLFCRSMPW